MNMDEQMQPIIRCYVTDLALSSVYTLSQLIKNQVIVSGWSTCGKRNKSAATEQVLATTSWPGNYSTLEKSYSKDNIFKSSRSQ